MSSSESKDEPEDIGSAENLPSAMFSIDERFNFMRAPERDPSGAGIPPQENTVHDLRSTVPMEAGEQADPESEREDPLLGQKVGNFEIIQRLGRGGFGSVYKALDVKLNRHVALKFLRFPLDPEYRKLFTREAQVLANLSQHPAIVQVYAWGEHQGSYYFALEFVDGSAEALLRQSGGQLSVRRALEIISQCAGALNYAHENGVFHRDIKPANILIDPKSGRAKLCDFGLARFRRLGADLSTAHLAGSPPYMAPEQVMGNEVDARTDVYGLGVTLYELLSGRLPFEGDSQANILERIRKGKEVPLSKRRPDLPPSIIKFVRRATAWHPKDRFQTATEIQRAADHLLAEMESGRGASRPGLSEYVLPLGRRRVVRTGLAGLVAAALFLAGLGYWLQPDEKGPDDGPGLPFVVAQAQEQVDAGKYADARTALDAYLREHPDDSYAIYVLGFVEFLSGDFEAAEDRFELIQDSGLRMEGFSALRHAQKKEGARAELEGALELVPTRYPAVLLASLDILKGDHASALKRLEAVDAERLNFEWQRRDLRLMLGRMYLDADDFRSAGAQLAMLPPDDPVGLAMRARAALQQNAEDRKARSEQIQRIVANAKSSREEVSDNWTSRPIRVRIEAPATAEVYTQYALDIARNFRRMLVGGLDLFPERPLEVVDRDFLDDTFAEQELAPLAEKLEGVPENLRIGKLLGARVLIESEFGTFLGEEFAQIMLIDVETTQMWQLAKLPLKPGFVREDVEAWLQNAVRLIHDELIKQLPLKGRLSLANGQLRLNIGTRVNVVEGMEFVAFATEKSGKPRPGVIVRAVEPIDADTAAVVIEGATPEDAATWVVEEKLDSPPPP